FAAISTTGSVYYHDVDDVTVGAVTGGTAVAASVSGVSATAANQNVELHVLGALMLNATVQVNAATGTVRLEGDTSVTQTATGNILGHQLSAQSNGDVDLCLADNDVDIFAAKGAAVHFFDINTFTIGSVTGGFCVTGAVVNITAPNEIDLKS